MMMGGERDRARGIGLYLGYSCWCLPPFFPAFAVKRKSNQTPGVWPHLTEVLTSSLPQPPSSTLNAIPQPPPHPTPLPTLPFGEP